jgi:NAD(P)-dependent dehydrogenase (short-subunit alcohol dehydrogenase family)
LAIEFAQEGIRFNTIAPGVVNTPMHPVENHEFLKQLSPMKRLTVRPITLNWPVSDNWQSLKGMRVEGETSMGSLCRILS